MADYGYADIGKLADFANNSREGLTANDIMRFPRADVQPVKHGKWEEIEEYGGWGDTYFRCSVCGDEWDLDAGTPIENGMKYCPNCGARMDGEKNE